MDITTTGGWDALEGITAMLGNHHIQHVHEITKGVQAGTPTKEGDPWQVPEPNMPAPQSGVNSQVITTLTMKGRERGNNNN